MALLPSNALNTGTWVFEIKPNAMHPYQLYTCFAKGLPKRPLPIHTTLEGFVHLNLPVDLQPCAKTINPDTSFP